MGRAPCCDKKGLKKGPWTPEEDIKLTDYIQEHGPGNWRNLPKNAGLQRCGKSCRLRWTNYLRPDIKRGRFSFEEEETIIQLHSVLGNKWSAIAARLPGRTDNEIKNYWNTHIRKRLLRMGIDPVTHSPRLDLLDLSSILGSSLCNPSLLGLTNLLNTQALLNPELLRLASTILSLNNNHKQENVINPLNPHDLFLQTLNSLQANQLPNLINQNNLMATHVTPAHPSVDFLGLPVNDDIPNPSTEVRENNNAIANITSTFADQALVADYLPEKSYFQDLLDYADKGFGFESVLSTPSSSVTPLNSSPTVTEDERESYCSNLLKFHELPESLDISDFL